MNIQIRQAIESDASQILEIYGPIVEHTAISFEIDTPSARDISGRIKAVLETHDWLVAVDTNEVVGYAYGSQYRPRKAYRFAAETTVYVKESRRGSGLGKTLYDALLLSLKSRGFRRAYAGIALPNDASKAIHRACGFTEIGVFPEAGFKFDRWHDVSWWQRKI